MNNIENYILIVSYKLPNNMYGTIRKAIYMSDAKTYIENGWNFTNKEDKILFENINNTNNEDNIQC